MLCENETRHINGMSVECSLLPRRHCRFGGARRPRAWCRRRPAALAAPRRAASVTGRALRGVFRHARAWHRRQEARLPCLRPRACGRARQARRRSARVFEIATRDEPAWLVARREPVQHALGMLYSIANSLGGSTGPGRAGSGALNTTTTTCSRTGPPTAGLCGAPLDGRLLLTLPTASAVSLLSLRPHPGACADLLASPALPMTAARTSARRPRRPRRARIARRSSGECQGG